MGKVVNLTKCCDVGSGENGSIQVLTGNMTGYMALDEMSTIV